MKKKLKKDNPEIDVPCVGRKSLLKEMNVDESDNHHIIKHMTEMLPMFMEQLIKSGPAAQIETFF